MNMNRFSFPLSFVIVLLGHLYNCQAATAPSGDHLVPIDPQSELGSEAAYRKIYEAKLFMTPGNLARFVQLPGPLAQPEVVISLYQRRKSRRTGSNEYWVTLTEPIGRLADCIPVDGERPKLNAQTMRVRRFDAPLPESTALAVNNAWLTMLRRASPDPCRECIAEGTTEIFSAVARDGKLLRATVPIKTEPNTLALTKLGLALGDYCYAAPDRRGETARDIEARARRLQMRTLE